MRCPHCHADIPDDASLCPRCEKPADESRGRVLEPELVDDHHRPLGASRPDAGNSYGADDGFTRIFYTTFPGGRGMPPACMPTIVTLALALFASIRFGLLAAIGFLVFAAVGRAVTFFLTIRHLLEGRFFNPWIPHLVTWVACWLLVAWLSGNLG